MPDSLDDWLITVDETVVSCEADRDRIGAVFVASACEAMLREIIVFGLQKQNVSPELISSQLDKAPRWKLLKLYNTVATNHIEAVLKEAELQSWWEAWDRLVKARNMYAHGKQISEGLAYTIRHVTRQMDKAFVTLRNAVLVPKSTTESIDVSGTQ